MADTLIMPEYSPKLDFVYQPKQIQLETKIEPMARRLDKATLVTRTQQQDSFMYNQGKKFMNLQILKRDQYTVTLRDQTVAPGTGAGSNPVTATQSGILNEFNFWPDNFCQSKAINAVKITCGDLTLESDQNERNPWLVEVKSSQFDLEECERYGQYPLFCDGLGSFNNNVLPVGPLSQNTVGSFTDAKDLPPMRNLNFAVFVDGVKQIQGMKKRWRVVGVPTFKDPTGTVANLTAIKKHNGTQNTELGEGEWVPYDPAGASWYYGPLEGKYVIEVEEYLVDKYLTTPYQKSKEPKCIKIAPQLYAQFFFNYDTNYISNGMFKWNPNNSQAGTNNATQHKMTVQRMPEQSSITIESFDILNPPPNGFDFKLITWEPKRIEAITQTVAPGATTGDITINDANDDILAKYMLISYLPEFWTGNYNDTLATAGCGPNTFSSYCPALITKCDIQIGQNTITQNIDINEQRKMAKDLINNPSLAPDIDAKKIIRYINRSAVFNMETGCPFLLLDLEKLSLESRDYNQQMANVQYPTLQQIKIILQIKNITNTKNNVTPQTLVYTPHIYKFYPFKTVQYEGGKSEHKQIFLSYQSADQILSSNLEVNPYMNFDMIKGGGWFDDARSSVTKFLKDNGQDILRMLVRGIRTGEEMTRGRSGHLGDLNTILNVGSDIAHNFGYGKTGKRGGAIQGGKKSW
jgi:hypothetical protein